jgi:hypothetical protein
VSTVRFTPELGRPLRAGGWEQVGASGWKLLREAIASGRQEEALELLDELSTESLEGINQYQDWVWALLSHIADRWGEDELPDAIRSTAGDWFRPFYDLCRRLEPADRVRLIVEGMRAQRGGPGLEGSVEVIEESDRWVLTFDPCGSGGRMRRGHELSGPPRSGPPWNLGATKSAHPWSWGREGVPYYCVHCCVVHELMTSEWGDGYPLWVTDFDPDPSKPTRWYVYKDPGQIPEEFFSRVGRKKPVSAWDRGGEP